jgi:hypothetical protein
MKIVSRALVGLEDVVIGETALASRPVSSYASPHKPHSPAPEFAAFNLARR